MKHAFTIAICLLMLAGTACKKGKKSPADDYPYLPTEMHYRETQCSNPWTGAGLTEAELKAKVEAWLQANGFEISRLRITSQAPVTACAACTCYTGRMVEVVFVKEEDIERSRPFGFHRPLEKYNK